CAVVTGWSYIHGVASALDTLCSQSYTSGKIIMVGVYLQRGVIISLLGFLPFACLWWEAEQVFKLIGQDPKISAQAGLYLKYLLFGAPAFLLFENLKRYLQAQGLTFMLVLYKPTSLGLIGAPISMAITYWLMFIFLAIYTKFINGYQAWGGLSRAAFYGWKRFLTLAIPGVLMVCSEWWSFEFISLLSGYLGEISLATQGIILTTANLLYQIPYGFSVAASARIGNLLGAGMIERAKTASKFSMQLAATIALLNATIYVHLGRRCSQAYVLCLTIPDCLNCVGLGVLRGKGRQNIGACLTVTGYLIIGLPTGILVGFNLGFGLQGFWIGAMTSSLAICITLSIIIWGTNWQRQLDKCKERMKIDRDRFEADVKSANLVNNCNVM
ncbi:26319_t:CDS:2, partial [Racocetra persica]